MLTKTKERDLKAWYMAAVKGDLVLNYGLMPKEADNAIKAYNLKGLLDECTTMQLHDAPESVGESMKELGIIQA